MKTLFSLIALILFIPSLLFAADGTSTATYSNKSNGDSIVTVTWVGSTDDGTVPDANIVGMGGKWLCSITTNPSSSTPTDNYTITLKYDGADILGGACSANRDTSNTEITYPIVDSVSGQRACVPVYGTLVFGLDDNSDTSSGGTVEFLFKK